MLRRIRAGLTPDIVALCAIIFLADVTSGVVSPTFSLFAQSLDVSLAMLGFLSTIGGLTQLLTSLPLGALSDRIGRTKVLLGGLGTFAAALVVMAAAHGLPLLLASRILMGAAVVGTFQIGAAHLGDITVPEQRPFAFGLYATAMGSGFTVGPLLGSQLAQYQSPRVAYLVGAAISLVGLAVAWRIHRAREAIAPGAGRPSALRNVREVLAHRSLMLVSFGNLLVSLTFAGAITTFFPIYGVQVSLTQAAIGTIFAVRALVSTLGRLPNGIISRYFGHQAVMLAALGLDAIVMFWMAHVTDVRLLTVLVAIEGLAFGAYLVSGQTYVADRTAVENRGAAVGVYSTASSIGGTAGPLALGIIAGTLGVARVFTATGITLAVGFALFLAATLALRRQGPVSRVGSSLLQPPRSEAR